MTDFEKSYELKVSTRKAQQSLRRFDNRLEKADKLLEKFGKTSKSIGKDLKKAGDTADRALGQKGRRAVEKFTRSIEKSDRRVKKFANSLRTVGSKMNRFVTLPITIAGVASLKFARDFNRSMATVATLIPGQTKRIKELKSSIQALSVETGLSTDELTEGAYAAISAWGDTADTMDRLGVVAKASQAGLATVKDTLGLFATITENYGDSTAAATEKVADFAFVTNKLAKEAPIADMAASMGKVVPIAKQLGVTQEDLFSVMTAGAGITGNVAEVSTQMRSVYTAIIKQTPKMAELIEKLNQKTGTNYKSAADALSKLGTQRFIKNIKDATKNTTEFQQAMGGRTEGLVLALALAGARADKYNEALTEMTDNSGQMRIAHREVTEGINEQGHEWEKTKRRLVVFAQRIGDKLLPVLSRLFKKFEPILDRIANMSEESLDFSIRLAGVVASIGPLIAILSRVIPMFGGLSSSIALTGASVAGLGGSVSTLVGQTAALGTFAKILSGIGGVTAAGVAAYAAGTVASKAYLEPQAEKKYQAREGFLQSGKTASLLSKNENVSLAYQEKALATAKMKQAAYMEHGHKYGLEDVAGEFTGLFTGLEKPSEYAKRARSTGEKGIEELEGTVKARRFEKWLEGGTGGYAQSAQPSQSIVISPSTSVTVEGWQMDERSFVNRVNRAIKKRDRDFEREISNISKQIAPSER